MPTANQRPGPSWSGQSRTGRDRAWRGVADRPGGSPTRSAGTLRELKIFLGAMLVEASGLAWSGTQRSRPAPSSESRSAAAAGPGARRGPTCLNNVPNLLCPARPGPLFALARTEQGRGQSRRSRRSPLTTPLDFLFHLDSGPLQSPAVFGAGRSKGRLRALRGRDKTQVGGGRDGYSPRLLFAHPLRRRSPQFAAACGGAVLFLAPRSALIHATAATRRARPAPRRLAVP